MVVSVNASPGAATRLTSPDYFLESIDLDQDQAQFLRIERGVYESSAFLDHRMHLPKNAAQRERVPLQSIPVADIPKPRMGYIFHTAFCCSTLLTRCLASGGDCRALREPDVLMQMANYKRLGHPAYADKSRWLVAVEKVNRLLGRHYDEREVVLVKPTNAANNLIPEIIQLPHCPPVVLLYGSLRDFLVSIAKKEQAYRTMLRRLFNVIRMDDGQSDQIEPRQLLELTDLQIAAFVWQLQIDHYLQTLGRFTNKPVCSLNFRHLLDQPRQTLAGLSAWFSLGFQAAHIEAIVTGNVFSRDAKHTGSKYSAAARKQEEEQTLQLFGRDIEDTLTWHQQAYHGTRPGLPLPRPLELRGSKSAQPVRGV